MGQQFFFVGNARYLEFDAWFDTASAPGTRTPAYIISINGDDGWHYKWEGTSVCWINGNQTTLGSHCFSPDQWNHFKLNLQTNTQGGPIPQLLEMGVIRMWVPQATSIHLDNVKFTLPQ